MTHGHRVSFGDDKMFGNYRETMIVQYHGCAKCHGIVHFKIVNFIFVLQLKKSINRAIPLLCSEAPHGLKTE